jgi:head-tail adaptor
MRIDPGDLDRRISIYKVTQKDDGTARVADDPLLVARRWAKKIDVSDAERVRAAQQGDEVISRFLVRSDSITRLLNASYEIDYRDVRYVITGIKESGERSDGLEISVTSQPDQSG